MKMRIMYIFMVLVSVLIGCGSDKENNESIIVPISCVDHTTSGEANVILIGDSITAGLPGDVISDNYINCGTCGAKTTDIIRDFNSTIVPKIDANKIDVAYVAIGVNDVAVDKYHGSDYFSYAKRLNIIVQNLQAKGIKVKLRSILPTNGKFIYLNEGTLNYNDVMMIVASSNGVEYINTREYFLDSSGYLNIKYTEGSDEVGIHLNSEGYAVYKENFN